MNNSPIGIFDSGLGGLSVWKEVVKLMPHEPIVYFSDSKNIPYGEKSIDEIIGFSDKIVNFLISKGCKLIIVACNTATVAAIRHLRATYPIEFVGMEPAIKPAAIHTKTGNIGILATKGTLESQKFNDTKNTFAGNVNVHMQIGYKLVELVEAGNEDSEECLNLLKEYIAPMLAHKIDHIVLGCTHYPFLFTQLQKVISPDVVIIDPAPAVARHVLNKLEALQLNAQPQTPVYEFFTTGEPDIMKTFLKKHFILKDILIQKI